MAQPYQIALFGAGRIGNVHARSIAEHKLTRLATVTDVAAGPAAALAAKYGARVVDEEAALGDIDTACVTLQTASGRIAIISNSRRASYGYDQRVEAHGSLGTLRTENIPQNLLVQEREDGVLREKPLFFFVERYAQSYIDEWAHFVRVLEGKAAASPSGEDGRRALLLAEAAYRSLETGRRIDLA